jgi:hypothetical protein
LPKDIITYQLSAISYQLSAISYQLSVVSFIEMKNPAASSGVSSLRGKIYIAVLHPCGKPTGSFGRLSDK